MTARVVLIGPMGAGKTRVGKRVARELGLEFSDTDKIVVAEHGPIAALFDSQGESHFRVLERAAVARALQGEGVVSLGGGAVLDPSTRAQLVELPVVYLTVTAEAVAPRIGDGRRPLVRDGIGEWERIFTLRRPIYEELADLTIDTSKRSYDSIAQEVARWTQQTV